MTLEIVRRIRGNVHGTIDVTAFEDAVIGEPEVQRLRRVKQLAFLSYVFPGASHSRFEHSLGVMQLAGVAWEKLESNQRRLRNSLTKYHDFEKREQESVQSQRYGFLAPTFPILDKVFKSDYNLQVLRLAALLHDIGHPPFSHSGERFMPSWWDLWQFQKNIAPAYLVDYLKKRCELIKSRGEDPTQKKVRHEVYSMLLIHNVISRVNESNEVSGLKIDPRDVVSVINTDVEPAEESPLHEHGVYLLLHELVSGELDIDRMDYLLRDSRECGVVYGIFDAGRILDSLCIYHNPRDQNLHVGINFSGLAAFEDYLRARQSMYLQLYFHKTSVGAEAMMQHLAKRIDNWCFPCDLHHYARLDENNIGDELLAAAEESLDHKNLEDYKRNLSDLMLHRRIWKRVFEVTAREKDEASFQSLKIAKEVLKREGVDFEQIDSTTSLTRFSPLHEDMNSEHTFRLIKKDEFQFPRVLPIEDYLSIVEGNQKIIIRRLYMDSSPGKGGLERYRNIRLEILNELQKRRMMS